MAINLSKNRDSLLSAWKEVVDDKYKTNWALFGYEGQTNDLKVVSKGDGGIEELTDDLNSGKIMYAFCKIVDPKTSLPKCVLINWQGEGAPLVRKGTCANHVRDIARFFIGAHVTINARTEEEVDRDIIMDKVSKSTGSAYSFKDRADTTDVTQDSGPVLKCQSSGGGAPHLILCPPPKPKNLKGTTYKRVIPTQEINSKERDMFWEKEELEEKQRQAEERKRKDEERKKLEDERKQREVAEALKREEKIKERTRTIVQLREAEKNAENRPHQDVSKAREWEKDIEESERDERERKTRSDILRRQRSQEAQAVISKRTIDARAIFEQNTSAGQMQSRIMPGRLQSIPNSNGQRLPSLASSSSFDSTSNMPNDQPSNIPINQQRKASLPTWPPTAISTEEVSPKSVGKRHWPPLVEGEPSHSVADAKPAGQNLSEPNASAVKRETANADDGEEEQDWETPPLEAGPEIRDPVGALLREQGQGAPAVIPGESPYHQLASQDSSAGHSEAQPSITVQSQTHNNGQEVDVRPTTEGQEADGASQFSNGMLEETVTFTEGDYGRTARALYDYQAADATEISFDPGDIITNIDQIDEGWWQGVGPDGTFGLFPANYVELLN